MHPEGCSRNDRHDAGPGRAPWTPSRALQTVVTAGLVLAPLAGAVWGAVSLTQGPPRLADVVVAALLYLVTAFGVTVGFHRLLTHRSFRADPWLRAVLTYAGTAAAEGGPVGWVAIHRRHHRTSDGVGDPHSPHGHGRGVVGILRGFLWAHTGWLFSGLAPNAEHDAPDLLADGMVRRADRLFPIVTTATFVVPLLLGLAVHRSWAGAWSMFLWAGLVRVFAVHQLTWSINSICHLVGRHRYDSGDESRDVWWLAIPSLGESWHNGHHAWPALARHGVRPGQLDPSARLIRLFEHAGWVTKARWPDARHR